MRKPIQWIGCSSPSMSVLELFANSRSLPKRFGPGCGAYYTLRGKNVVVLLCGGDKDGQMRDIARAKALAKEVIDGD